MVCVLKIGKDLQWGVSNKVLLVDILEIEKYIISKNIDNHLDGCILACVVYRAQMLPLMLHTTTGTVLLDMILAHIYTNIKGRHNFLCGIAYCGPLSRSINNNECIPIISCIRDCVVTETYQDLFDFLLHINDGRLGGLFPIRDLGEGVNTVCLFVTCTVSSTSQGRTASSTFPFFFEFDSIERATVLQQCYPKAR